MRLELKKGKAVLLKGPASASLESGAVEVFGHKPRRGESVVVKPWKTVPITALEDSTVVLSLGTGSSYEELDFDPIPESWRRLAGSLGGSFKAMALGRIDSGKTSVLLTLLNGSVSRGEVHFVDLDVGQGEICPPTTIGYAKAGSSTHALYSLRAEAVYAFGFTSPSLCVGRSIAVARRVLQDLAGAERVLIDVDGWVDGDDAIHHKSELIRAVRPTHVLLMGIEPGEEIGRAIEEVGAEAVFLERPETMASRSREERKRAREMRTSNAFRESSVRQLVKSWVRYSTVVSDSFIDDPEPYFEEAVLDAERHGVDAALLAPDELDTGPDLRRAGVGLLSYVLDERSRVLSLAMLMGFVKSKNAVRILTSYRDAVRHLKLGAVFLSSDFQELHVFRPSERWCTA